jgi:formylglycine-generating enzyme required for sulfatase activity
VTSQIRRLTKLTRSPNRVGLQSGRPRWTLPPLKSHAHAGPQSNNWGSGDPYEYPNGYTTPVGYYDGSNHGGYQTINSPSPYGLYDVSGGVREWCSTKYAGYPYNPNDGREVPPVSGSDCRVLRGGSYLYSHRNRCADSAYRSPYERYDYGFRCVRTGS